VPRLLRRAIWSLALVGAMAGVQPAAALTITPLFDSSITGAANAAQVEGAINAAIGTIDSLYSNNGNVGIVFTQAPGSFLGQSQSADYAESYANYKGLLTAASASQPTNTVLSTAVANLSSGNMPRNGGSVAVTSADLRVALGVAGASGCFNSGGTFVNSCGQAFDGVVTLTTSVPLNYTKTPVAGQFSAIDTVAHEVNEILGGGGQGSVLNAIADGLTAFANDLGVLDLYRYSAPGVPSFTTNAAATAYFSVDGGVTDIVGFNQTSTGDFGDFSTNNNIQSAFSNSGVVAPYNASTPEFPTLESIGFDGVVPEPASLVLLATGILGLRAVKRRRVRVVE
jgi:hypothetical protein